MIYLDYSASAPISEAVLDRMIEVYRTDIGNPDSRTHEFGANAMKIVKEAQNQVADLLGTETQNIFFTSGATESNNMAIQGLIRYACQNNKKHIVSSSIEHKSVLETLKYMEQEGFEVTLIDPDENGLIDENRYLDAVRDDTFLGILMHVNNETGVIQPIDRIGRELHQRGIFFLVDATQSAGKLVPELQSAEYDFLSFSAHKLQGPQGIGVLVARKRNVLTPILFGGNQQQKLRPGTVPTALVAGLGEACLQASKLWQRNREKTDQLFDLAVSTIEASGIRYQINGDLDRSLRNIINISFDDVSSEALMIMMKGVCAISNGSACNSDSYNLSYVLENMGLDEERLNNAVRISWGPDTDPAEMKAAIQAMCEAVQSFQ